LASRHLWPDQPAPTSSCCNKPWVTRQSPPHTYADLFDSDLDRVAEALDALNDAPENSKTDFGCYLDGSDAKPTLDNRATQH